MTFRELLVAAKSGDKCAIDSLIAMYNPLITRYSYLDGELNPDLYHEQILRFLRCVKKFSLDFLD